MSGFQVSKLRENPVKVKLAGGEPAIGSWLSLCSPAAAEAMAPLGWDWLVVDAQHSPVGFETMVNCFRAIQLGGSIPMARVPWLETTWIQRTLDAGALGLVVPMVNSAEEARQAVATTKYGPGRAPGRAAAASVAMSTGSTSSGPTTTSPSSS